MQAIVDLKVYLTLPLTIGAKMNPQSFEHQLPFLAAKITIKTENKSSIGTAFFYKAPLNNGTDSAIILLISNKHVFINPKGRLIVSLNRVKENGEPDLGNIMTFDQVGFEEAYFVHPDPEVDLACINVSSITQMNAHYRHLNEIFLKPIDYEKVAPGSDVIFVGYPNNRYDIVNNLPLVRKGAIASMPNIDFNGKGQIVIDAQIFEGSSGSPVFVCWDDRYSLLGVVSQTMIRHSQLQTLPMNMSSVGVEQTLGLGIVIKQQHVQELIDYAVKEHIRRKS